eukprot:739976_1
MENVMDSDGVVGERGPSVTEHHHPIQNTSMARSSSKQNNATVRWLNENDLSCIVEQCLQNEITFDVLIEADLDDIKSMCKDANIKTQHRLKLQSALKRTINSRLEIDIEDKQKSEDDGNIYVDVPHEEKCPVINNINVFTVSSDTETDPDIATKKHDVRFKILLIGDSAVGKSSIMVRFKQDIFNDSFISTIGVDFAIKKLQIGDKIVKLQVWDTAGQERFRAITARYYKGADAVCIVYNITEKSSFENIKWWLSEVRKHAAGDVIVYVIGAKNDLEEKREVTYEEGQLLCKAENCEFYEVSAKTGRNIPQLFNAIAVHLLSIASNDNDNQQKKRKNDNNIILSSRQTKKKKRKCCHK